MKTNTPGATPSHPPVDAARRRWLQFAAAAPVLAASGPSEALPFKTQARIVIAGSGLGGLAVAYRLSKLLDGARITIVDRKAEHNYQPGYTLVATGVWSMEQVRARNADLQPAGVEWVRDMAAGFDPVAKVVTTADGQRVPYDFLVVATGVHLDYAQIEGMDVALIGKDGLVTSTATPRARSSPARDRPC